MTTLDFSIRSTKHRCNWLCRYQSKTSNRLPRCCANLTNRSSLVAAGQQLKCDSNRVRSCKLYLPPIPRPEPIIKPCWLVRLENTTQLFTPRHHHHFATWKLCDDGNKKSYRVVVAVRRLTCTARHGDDSILRPNGRYSAPDSMRLAGWLATWSLLRHRMNRHRQLGGC